MTTLAQRLTRHDRLTCALRSPWLTLAIALLTLGLFWLARRGWLGQGGEGACQGLSEERGGSGHAPNFNQRTNQ